MVNYILKYETGNLIIIYYCAYSRLIDTIVDVIQNFIELMRSTDSGSCVDG